MNTFRIIAVVSLPQTAFSANGAGVKSSVLFLKKFSPFEKRQRKDLRDKIQNNLISNTEKGTCLLKLLKEKKDSIAQINKMLKQAKNDNDSEAEEALRNKKQAAAEEFDEKIEKVREELRDYNIILDIIKVDEHKDGYSDYIYRRIVEGIDSCDLLIADLTYGNKNVHHEIGYAQGRGKKGAAALSCSGWSRSI